MKATSFEFRFRVLIAILLYVIGFWAPWTRYGAVAPDTTAWLALSTTLAGWQWLTVNQATLLVTWLAILFAFAGAALRIWGTAYLGSFVVHSTQMQAGLVVASGPYRFVRNPLYLGTWFFSLGVSILMPPSGAIVFLLATFFFYFRLILGEEHYLAARLGASYLEYRHCVPRILPSLRPCLAASGLRAQWMQGFLGEIFTFAFACCLAALAWQYDAHLLLRCVLVCFGLSLVARAVLPKPQLLGH
ncbi:MAG TPA: isoprenylcysteine carboxylmethyltransferase family protein [Acidobacteriaceae bacterium]|nr:isoprenylcysteine carboxylmethyltransferase family protein [Acidobacteriaceae bacterium]